MDSGNPKARFMRSISTFPHVYIYRGKVDFRKSIDGLSSIVMSEMKRSPMSGAMFLFMGRRRDRIKILYWDKTGFCLWYKRLEEAKYFWPKLISGETSNGVVELTGQQLEWLLDGIDIWKIKSHEEVRFENLA